MKRSGPIKSDPAKTRAWQARGAKKYADRQRPSDIRPNDIQAIVTPKQSGLSEYRARQEAARALLTDPTVAEVVTARSEPRPQPKPKRSKKKPRNDSGWRAEVMARYGPACVRCGDRAHVQADHMWPRGQGGPSDVRNGLPLCGEFSRNTPGGCHPMKTASTIVIEPDWLAQEQIDWLAEVGWVAWDEHGQPYGRGWKHFAPQRVA